MSLEWPALRWSESSPDGLHGIAIFPEMGWQVASGPIDQFDPCPSAPMASPRDYLEFVMRGARPIARSSPTAIVPNSWPRSTRTSDSSRSVRWARTPIMPVSC